LDSVRGQLTQHYREISERESVVTAEKIRNAFLGHHSNNITLLELFDEHINTLKSKLQKQLVSDILVKRYERTANRLKQYMQEKYKISDIDIKEINYSFIYGFAD
jgi:ATP-dependent protease HslVU (ClpYQ) peptidase subunit